MVGEEFSGLNLNSRYIIWFSLLQKIPHATQHGYKDFLIKKIYMVRYTATGERDAEGNGLSKKF